MEQKELLSHLETMKTALEGSLAEKAKTEIEGQLTEQLKLVNDKIEEVKKLADNAAELKQIKDQMIDLKADYAIVLRDFNTLQTRVKGSTTLEPEVKGLDARIAEAVEEKHDDIQKFIRKETKKVSIDLKAVGAVSTANVTGTTVWGAQYRPGIIMSPDTMVHVRSLLNVSAAGPGTDYYFMKENGAGEGSIAATSETTAAAAATTQATGLKPQFDQDLVESSVKFETIAGWMLMSKKAMNNIPGFIGYLQSRLPERLLNAEDAYALYGTGTSPEIKGLLTSGNFTASTSSATVLAESIIDDMSLLEDTYKRFANGIVLRPADYFSFFKNKADGSGEYDLPQGFTFVNGVLYILGVPVSKTTALTAGDYIVGDFRNGADLLVQQGMTLEFFEQDSTNVRTNQITVRIEESIAMPVYGSDYFIKGAVPTP